jgi:serine/threonine protein kinase
VGPRGRYRIEGIHGGGASGVTHRGARVEDERPVIVKCLRLAGLPGWKALELFEREAAVLRALSHPGIPAWIDDFPLGDPAVPAGFALVMELVPGPTLRQVIRAAGLDRDQMLTWLGDLLEVLAYIHGRAPPLIHRDVNPKNIVLRPDGPAALVDFGSVQAALRSSDGGAPTSTGTFGYAPLEQFMGQACPGSDLYGAGISYLAAATGREPEHMPLRGIKVDVPRLLPEEPRLVRLLEAMVEPDPRSRLATATEGLTLLSPIRRRIASRPDPSSRPSEPAPLAEPATEASRPDPSSRPSESVLLAEPATENAVSVRPPRPTGTARRSHQVHQLDHRSSTYLDRLARALPAAGFSLIPGGNVGHTPLAFQALRPARGLADEAICLYAAAAEAIDGAPADKPMPPVPAALFMQAVADQHPRSSGLLRRLLDDRSIVVPLIVCSAGIGARTCGHLAETLREPAHLTVIGALVDPAAQVQLVPPKSLLAGDPDDRVGRVRRALATDTLPFQL